MRIAIVGIGGVGAAFGAPLAAAGEDVVFVARGETLRALKEHGLILESEDGSLVLPELHATDDPASLPPVDAILLAVKSWQVGDAARLAAPMVGPHTVVVPLQNGVEATERATSALGPGPVAVGLCGTVSWIVAPGRIRSAGGIRYIQFAEPDGRPSARLERLRDAFVRAGVRAEIPQDVGAALWRKFLFIAPIGAIGAASRVPIGTIRAVPESRALLERGMREVLALARARGIGLPDAVIGETMRFTDSLGAGATSSLHRDLIEGRRSELDDLAGAVVRLGREAGVPVPVHETLYASLLPLELAARVR